MSTVALLKVPDTHVQESLKEVLKQVHDATVRPEGSPLASDGFSGCMVRSSSDRSLSPNLMLAELEKEGTTDGKQSSGRFEFFLHHEADGHTCCCSYSTIARAEQTSVAVKLHDDGSWSSVVKTRAVYLTRMCSSVDRNNNALSAQRITTVTTQKNGPEDSRTSSREIVTSSHKLLATFSELNETLAEFLDLALPGPSA